MNKNNDLWEEKQQHLNQKIISMDTLDACNQAQLDMRKHVRQLIQENRCLESEAEKEYFHFRIPYSTLGLATSVPVRFFTPYSLNEQGERRGGFLAYNSHLEWFARWLADENNNMVRFTNLEKGYGHREDQWVYYEIEINRLWKKLLAGLYHVFPIAVQRAASMSKGTEEKIGDKEFNIDE